MNYQITPEEFTQRIVSARTGAQIREMGKHILIACMPKSGSTFLTAAIASVPGIHNVTLSFGHDRREHELCLAACALAHDINYVAQQHVRYSRATRDILKTFHIHPVILMRNIFDCVVSLRDHLEQEDYLLPMAYLPDGILQLPREKQYDVIIDLAVPWYANFFACWAEYDGPATRILYREFIADPASTIANILKAAGLETSQLLINAAIESAKEKNTRLNVGRVGRGSEELTARQIGRIRELFSYYSAFSGVDDILYLKSQGKIVNW